MFDRLLLLDKTGTTLYFGDIGQDAAMLIDYFESNGAPKCHPEENPAEWMLEVTGNRSEVDEGSKTQENEWPAKWQRSQQKRDVLRQLKDLKSDLAHTTPPTASEACHGEYAISLLGQLRVVSTRIFQDQWRDPVYLRSKVIQFILIVKLSTSSILAYQH
jgi:ATP-binding cassette, subfamily G (WHITE), member 2, PDR